ncbi:hypothetical protein D9M71_264870 [compost metagenome]
MGGATAAPHGATAAMEQEQLHLMLAANLHQAFLGPVLRPGGRHRAGILGRVGVTDHHLLRTMQPLAITGQAQQAFDDRAGVVQVGQGLEKWHHADRPLQPGFLEQQLHRQHIGRRPGHGDHVRTQGGGRRAGHHSAGGEHFGGVGRWPVVRRQQRAAVV